MQDHCKHCESAADGGDCLKKQADDLANILDHSQDIIYRFNFETNRYDYLSGNVEQLTGFTPQEIMEAGPDFLLESLHPEDKPQFLEIYNGLINSTINTSDLHLEYRTQHKDGHYVHRSDSIKIIRDQNNRISAVLGSARDITQHQQTAQQLSISEQRYKRLAEAAFEGIAIHEQGIILDVNQQFCDMFGYTSEELIGTDGLRLIAPQSKEMVMAYIQQGYEGPYEAYNIRKDGSVFPLEVRAREFQMDGKTVRVATYRDLTIEKQNLKKLEQSEKRYRNLYDNANVALFRTAMDGTLLDCNRATWDFFGHPYETDDKIPENYSVTEAYVDPVRRQEFVLALQSKGYVKHFEVQLRRADGKLFWAAISATLNKQERCIEGTLYDITIKKVLTKTEKQILNYLMEGKTNKEIAFQTGRSTRTIEDHRAHIMQKLGVDNLVDLTKKAISFEPPSDK